MKTLLLALLLPLGVFAQTELDGLWEGHMTVGGIYSNEALPMQLYLSTEGNTIKGRSYVTLPDGEILRMDLKGYMYGDRSIGMVEVAFVGDSDNDVMPEFNRQYQIDFAPDLWDSELKGFWQEITSETFKGSRRRGRMVLKKAKNARA